VKICGIHGNATPIHAFSAGLLGMRNACDKSGGEVEDGVSSAWSEYECMWDDLCQISLSPPMPE